MDFSGSMNLVLLPLTSTSKITATTASEIGKTIGQERSEGEISVKGEDNAELDRQSEFSSQPC